MDDPTSPLNLLIRKLEARTPLSPSDREEIRALPCRMKALEASTYVVREGDHPDNCAILGSGYAYRQKLTGDGRRQIISLHIPGELLDLHHLFLDVADHSVQMLTRGQVCIVPRKDLQNLHATNPTLSRAFTVDVLADASIFREWVLNVGRRDARSRLAHVLCEVAVRMQAQGMGDSSDYELPITQEQLADALGLTPVHVNRTLKSLVAAGLIVRDRRHILIPDWEKLRDVADFNRRYLHLEPRTPPRLA